MSQSSTFQGVLLPKGEIPNNKDIDQAACFSIKTSVLTVLRYTYHLCFNSFKPGVPFMEHRQTE